MSYPNLNARSSFFSTRVFPPSSAPAASTAPADSSSFGPFGRLFLSGGGGSTWAREDVREYLNHYPNQPQRLRARKNIDFYLNQIPSAPAPCGTIEQIHKKWKGNYELLEMHHGYIQFLFPIRENGMNSSSQMLYLHEMSELLSSPDLRPRLLTSYRMMLDFYGMRLVDDVTGEVDRATNFESRYRHLNRSTHNYLRITRILKCLGELGLEEIKLGFLLHIVREILAGELNPNSVGKSARDYWFPVLRLSSDRAILRSTLATLAHAEAHAIRNRTGEEIQLTQERIKEVLKEAQEARKQGNNGTSAGVTTHTAAASSVASPPSSSASPASLPSVSPIDASLVDDVASTVSPSLDDSVDSPRAFAEGAAGITDDRAESDSLSDSPPVESPADATSNRKRKADGEPDKQN